MDDNELIPAAECQTINRVSTHAPASVSSSAAVAGQAEASSAKSITILSSSRADFMRFIESTNKPAP